MAQLAFPKDRIKILLLEGIHQSAVEVFKREGNPVTHLPHAVSEEDLAERIQGVHVLGIRSKTQVSPRVLERADKLLCVGAFCIGTNQIHLQAAARKGVAVFNAPYSNTRSVAELALGEIIMLSRKTFQRSSEMHQGIWKKTAAGSYEIRGKTLGIVGYGNIGSQLSELAEQAGMHVLFYDTADVLKRGNAEQSPTLDHVLETSDVITIHVDGRKENTGLIGYKEFAKMKDRALFLNLSRGHIVDDDALAACLKDGKLGGAAVDVYPEEPNNSEAFESPLKGLPNVIITPHVAGSTVEAQRDIGNDASRKVVSFINTGNTTGSVNFPEVQLPPQESHRLLHIHKNVPGMLGQINGAFEDRGINILGQYLSTNAEVGYAIVDFEQVKSSEVHQAVKAIPGTIKSRMLY